MYNLGEQFKLNMERALAKHANVTAGTKYRFTVLTPRVIRLEYSPSGIFTDAPTELVWYRDLPNAKFKVNESNTSLEIVTDYFKLTYVKEQPFAGNKVNPSANLKVELLGTDRYWYFGHPEVRNLGLPQTTLEGINIKQKGLYSADGIASIDDSNSKVFNEDGTVSIRQNEEIDIYLFMYHKDYEEALKDYY